LPIQKNLKEKFITQSNVFSPLERNQEMFLKIQERALKISQIYGHKGIKGVSTVDLLLGTRLSTHKDNSIIVTANKKYFSKCLFDTLSVITQEKKRVTHIPFFS